MSSLVNGACVFDNTQLASFNGDLSSLVNGNCMFRNVLLTPESIEIILDELPNKADISVDGNGNHKFDVLGDTQTITASEVCTLTVNIANIDTWSDADKTHITSLFE